MTKSKTILFFLLCIFTFNSQAQQTDKVYQALNSLSLKGVPPLRVDITDTIKGCDNLLFTTQVYNCLPDPVNANNLTVQLVDPQKPYPPLWFFNFKCADEAEISDAKILENGNISFYLREPGYSIPLPKNKMEISEAMLEGYVQLDKSFNFHEFFASVFMGSYDYQVLPDGRRIYIRTSGKKVNLSKIVFKGTKLGSGVYVSSEKIEIMDAQNNIVFTWDPLDHLSFDEMYYDEYADLISHSEKFDQFNFSRLNSVRIDPFDGNLLISYNRLDACMKVDITTGNIIWRLGGKKSDFLLADEAKFHLQNDFQRITSGEYKGKYSLYSNGSKAHPYAEAFVFDIDEKNKTAKMVKKFRPEPNFISNFSGNFEILENEKSLVNYADKGPIDAIPHFALVDSFKKITANFYAPVSVTTSRVTCANIPEIKRPVISCDNKEGKIILTAHGNFDFFQWSTGDTTASIMVVDTGTYYAVGQLGIGGVPSEFFKVSSIENFACPDVKIFSQEIYQYIKKTGKKEATTGSILIDLPFYYNRKIKGEVMIDFDKEFYIIKPLAEN